MCMLLCSVILWAYVFHRVLIIRVCLHIYAHTHFLLVVFVVMLCYRSCVVVPLSLFKLVLCLCTHTQNLCMCARLKNKFRRMTPQPGGVRYGAGIKEHMPAQVKRERYSQPDLRFRRSRKLCLSQTFASVHVFAMTSTPIHPPISLIHALSTLYQTTTATWHIHDDSGSRGSDDTHQ